MWRMRAYRVVWERPLNPAATSSLLDKASRLIFDAGYVLEAFVYAPFELPVWGVAQHSRHIALETPLLRLRVHCRLQLKEERHAMRTYLPRSRAAYPIEDITTIDDSDVTR